MTADATLKRNTVLSAEAVARSLQSGETDKAATLPAAEPEPEQLRRYYKIYLK